MFSWMYCWYNILVFCGFSVKLDTKCVNIDIYLFIIDIYLFIACCDIFSLFIKWNCLKQPGLAENKEGKHAFWGQRPYILQLLWENLHFETLSRTSFHLNWERLSWHLGLSSQIKESKLCDFCCFTMCNKEFFITTL